MHLSVSFSVVAATAVCAAVCVVLFSARPAASEEPPTAGETYAAIIEANNAAAAAWRAANPDGVTNGPSDAEAFASDNHGCPEGSVPWFRDSITDICAPVCTSDADCGPEDGRCRVLDVADKSRVVDIVLVDDLPPEEIEAWMTGTADVSPPVMLCDPFWDFAGATDAAEAFE